MRSLRIRPIAHPVKILTAGALLAAGTAGFVLPGASAAERWSTIAKANAHYWCLSGCVAGGVGPVDRGIEAVAGNFRDIDPSRARIIGGWRRTVHIECKVVPHETHGRGYHVIVGDKGWKGKWEVDRIHMEQNIDDKSFPVCTDNQVIVPQPPPPPQPSWSAVAPWDAQYWCVSGCTAGGVGPVGNKTGVAPPNDANPDLPKIGAWKRTVHITCKFIPDERTPRVYQVTVKDKEWKGTWEVHKYYLEQEQKGGIDDSAYPVCGGEPVPTR